MVASEPLTGRRLVEASRQRAKADYCRFMRRVPELSPRAEKAVLVQDNLNTHSAGSFYENLPAAEALALARRFEMHYTPKKGSWLDMAESGLSALSRSCLARRISSIEELDREVQAIVNTSLPGFHLAASRRNRAAGVGKGPGWRKLRGLKLI